MRSLTIGRLARQAGVNLETVRFYERKGLLPRPPRSASGYRLFPTETARRLKLIRRAQELGFSLSEIAELLSLRVSRRTTSAEIRARAEAKIADIEAKLKSLESVKKTLQKLTKVCDGCAPLALAALVFRANKRRGYDPFFFGLVAGSVVLLGKFVLECNLIVYGALGPLVIASLWNAWPLAEMAGEEATCPECLNKEL